MAEDEAPLIQKDAPEPASRRDTDTALAASTPDESHLLMRMIAMLLHADGFFGSKFLGLFGSMFIVFTWVFSKFGVPAILAIQAIILQLHTDELDLKKSQLDAQAERVKLTEQLQAEQARSADLAARLKSSYERHHEQILEPIK